MAKKKAKKEVKRLKKMAKKLTAANLTLEKQIRKLQKKLSDQQQRTGDRQTGLGRDTPVTQAPSPSTAEIGATDGTGIASSQRAAWKQHSYLRDRYELHLDTGATKDEARRLANDDLEEKYGSDSGYSEDELSAILS